MPPDEVITTPEIEEKFTPEELVRYTRLLIANKELSLFSNRLLDLVWTIMVRSYVAGAESRPLIRADFEDIVHRWVTDSTHDSLELSYNVDSRDELPRIFEQRFNELRALEDPEVREFLRLRNKFAGIHVHRYRMPDDTHT